MHNTLTQEQFIIRSINKHGYKYDYSKSIYKNTIDNIIIICMEHGKFLQSPGKHMDGRGCPKCGAVSHSNKSRKSVDKFIEDSNKKHNYKYNYSNVKYINSKTKVIIQCDVHGDFEQTPSNHLKGCGCFKCGLLKRDKLISEKSFSNFIEKCKLVHGPIYDYNYVVYNGSKEEVCIRCLKHNTIFYQSPSLHASGFTGCKTCSKTESRGEKRVRLFLELNNIEYSREKKFKSCKIKANGIMRFDFYLPKYNLLIEYDGEQHFKSFVTDARDYSEKDFKMIQLRDAFKTKWAEDNGYNLLRIPYFELKNINKILKSYINGDTCILS